MCVCVSPRGEKMVRQIRLKACIILVDFPVSSQNPQ